MNNRERGYQFASYEYNYLEICKLFIFRRSYTSIFFQTKTYKMIFKKSKLYTCTKKVGRCFKNLQYALDANNTIIEVESQLVTITYLSI